MDEIKGSKVEEDSQTEKTREPEQNRGTLLKLFMHSDLVDKWLVVMGSIGCFADGASTPLIMLVLSRLYNDYAISSSMISITVINREALNLLYVALGVGMGAFLEGVCWARTAERQISSLRIKYLRAILRQDVGYFDLSASNSTTSQVVSTVSIDTQTIQDALSEKIPNFLMNMATFFTSQTVALYLSWRLSLVTLPLLTLLIVPGIIYGKMLVETGRKIHEAYGVAGGIVEQALSSIRTVYSYVGECQTEKSYSKALSRSLVLGLKQGMMKGMAIGSVGIGFAVWAFQAWYGSVLVIDHGAKGGDVYNAGVCVVVGGLALGGAMANFKYFSEATVAAAKIFELIERVPCIDSEDHQGEIMQDVQGEIEFKDVEFSYPSRPNNMILQKFNLRVMAGKTVGLVGGSGSGKSTIISLLERFYDPLDGEILLDRKSIRNLQLKWLRYQIGLVSQEPVLFATSIEENIMFGKEDASMELVVSAAKAANAHTFIDQLPDRYDTQVGQFGLQMSGGQKQRIAIARALLKDPRILLLDEATSALDSQSEKIVQDALDQASEGRTTIVVAHRLSTLRNTDMIVVLQSGQVVESGSHDQLFQIKNGVYSTMVKLQNSTLTDDEASTPKESNDGYSLTSTEDTSVEIPNRSRNDLSFHDEDQIRSQKEINYSPPSLWRLLKMTSPEWKNSLLGCLGAICFGGVQPVHSFIMGAILSVYFIDDHDRIKSQIKFYCLVALTYALFSFITSVIQHYNFGIMGENLTRRLRESIVEKVLTFEIGWFDQETNTSGAICARLAKDANMVRSLVCDRLSLLAQVFSGAAIALAMALILSWRLSIVILALQPLIIGSFYGKGVLMKTMSKKLLKAQDKCSQLASDAVVNHRTITSYSSQEKIMGLFRDTLQGSRTESKKQSWFAGFGLLISQFATAANVGLIFWYGGHLLHQGRISYKHLFQTFFILVTTGRVIAEAGSMTSDIVKGVDAIKSVFIILDRKTKIDPDDPEGIKPEKIHGYVQIKEVMFCYPSRPKQMILKGLSLEIEAGKTVALVGQSGSGKSTIISLIGRFYDPLRGFIEIDSVDIKRYNLRSLRTHIALVSQEPTLFAGSIHENIVYGKDNVTESEIIEAATQANAHEFISCMKDGYGTYCGERGVQLSGGQKQRIALARAILKNPAILLLDEATSALDSKSEGLVQEAIEKLMAGRTCIVVAHRLATIQKSDSITVIENGKIVEEGSHSELLGKGERSHYFSLVRLQQDTNLEPWKT